jgi:molecular chaperone DnaK
VQALEHDAEVEAKESPARAGHMYLRAASEALRAGAHDDAVRLCGKPSVRYLLRNRNRDALRTVKDAAVAVSATRAGTACGLYDVLLGAMEANRSYPDTDLFIEFSRLQFTRGEFDKSVAGLARAKAAYLCRGDPERASWCACAQVAVRLHQRDLAAAEGLLANERQQPWFSAGDAASAIDSLIQGVKGGTSTTVARWMLFGILSDAKPLRFGFRQDGEPRNLAWLPDAANFWFPRLGPALDLGRIAGQQSNESELPSLRPCPPAQPRRPNVRFGRPTTSASPGGDAKIPKASPRLRGVTPVASVATQTSPFPEPSSTLPSLSVTPKPGTRGIQLSESEDLDALLASGPDLPSSRCYAGIDLGTSECRFAVFAEAEGRPRIGISSFPCLVRLDGESLAISDNLNDPAVIYAAKRLIGHSFAEDERAELGETFHFPISFDESGRPAIQLPGGETHSPVQIISSILAEVRTRLSEKLRIDLTQAVISVPAFFCDSQRRAISDAGKIAGFESVHLVSDAVAVLLATRNARPSSPVDRKLVIVDFGAGKLDLSIVNEIKNEFTLYRTAGDTAFGGIDYDAKLCSALAKDVSLDDSGKRRLFAECNRVRHALSEHDQASLSLRDLKLNRTVSGAAASAICADLYTHISASLDQLFEGEEGLIGEISEVLIAGGLSNDPKVVQIIKDYFANKPTFTVCPANAVVLGATFQGAIQAGVSSDALPDILIRLTNPRSIGFSLSVGSTQILIRRGTILPVTKSVVTTTYRDNQRRVVFNVLEGESSTTSDNIVLGRMTVDGIQEAPKGVPHIVITMKIDENGLLTVHASDLASEASIVTTLQSAANLSPKEIKAMIETTQAMDLKIRKIHAWKTRFDRYLEKLQVTTVAKRQRTQFERLLGNAEEWIAIHYEEQDPDVYATKCRELRELVTPFLAVQVERRGDSASRSRASSTAQ